MLVLTRKEGESLLIGDDVVITVLKIEGNRMKIGIDAPKKTRVVRGELQKFERTEVEVQL